MTVEAGWYRDGNTPGIERWWDGSAWTSETRPIAAGIPERAAGAREAAVPCDVGANSETPPGWYPDPEAGFRWRFWTGSSWTSAIMVAKKRGQLGGKLSAIMIVACILSVPGSLFALYGALPTCEGGRALWEGECRPLNDITRSTGIDPVLHPWFLVGGLVAVIAAFLAITFVHKARFPKAPVRPTLQPRNALNIHGLTPPGLVVLSDFQPYGYVSAQNRRTLALYAIAVLGLGWIGIVGAITSPSIATRLEIRSAEIDQKARVDAEAAGLESAAARAADRDAKRAEAVAAAVVSCDVTKLAVILNDEAALRAWLRCPESEVQVVARDAIAFKFTYPRGSTGPGGGVVFYASLKRESWGQFLEVAPASWSGAMKDGRWADPRAAWCKKSKAGYDTLIETDDEIGAGATNSKAIIKACGWGSAAGLAASYQGGGKHDWFLPTLRELE